ncbi:uncharacterized protein METZ01_LOCUS480596 [marine metagenome]|uniref:Uncharacterized protein n=1 Tax=marine metagenome TaxID=408172 RepID=A0A383C694_9ZZZZ
MQQLNIAIPRLILQRHTSASGPPARLHPNLLETKL